MNYFLILAFLMSSLSCTEKQGSQLTELSYKAQTRGFLYLIEVQGDTLNRKKNSNEVNIKLNEDQQEEIIAMLTSIDFESLENNIEYAQLAVDAAIKGTMKISFSNKTHKFEFDHNKLPDPILQLLQQLESYN